MSNRTGGTLSNRIFRPETTAKQLSPDEYGEFPGLGEIPEDEQLFSRERIADIVAGNP